MPNECIQSPGARIAFDEAKMLTRVVMVGVLSITCAAVAWADAEGDCGSSRSLNVRLQGCTAVIEDLSSTATQMAAALRNRAAVRAAAGAQVEALRDYDSAIAINAADADSYAGRGEVRLARGDHWGSVVDLGEAIRLKPKFYPFLLARGHAYLVGDNFNAAIADFTAALALKPGSVVALNDRGVAYRKNGELDRAIADYTAAVEANRLYAVAYLNRGHAYEAQRQKQKAGDDYARALLLNPTLSGAKYGLRRLGRGREIKEAETLAEQGKNLAEQHCARCHATSAGGTSPNAKAPEFRFIQWRHPMVALNEPLTRAIAAPHDEMPKFDLADADIDRVVAYISTLTQSP